MEMYCRKVLPLTVFVFGSVVCHSALGFTPSNSLVKGYTRNTNSRNTSSLWPKSSLARTKLLETTNCNNHNPTFLRSSRGYDNEQYRSDDNDDNVIIVVDWECIVDSLPYYTQLGIHAARTVWPHLNDLCDDNDLGWVENKIAAISHVLSPPTTSSYRSNQYHPACEYALATRLILEEQALDKNQSTGKLGKYSRRYHPRVELPLSRGGNPGQLNIDNNTNDNPNNDDDNDDKTDANNRVSSDYYRPIVSTRPLTVGEMAVNWRDSIRETLQVRYQCNSKDPIPLLDATIQEVIQHELQQRRESSSQSMTTTRQQQQQRPMVQLFPQTKFALSNTVRKVLIQTRHENEYEILLQSLDYDSGKFQTALSVDDALLCDQKNGMVVLRPTVKGSGGTKSEAFRQVLHHPSSTASENEISQTTTTPTTVIYIDSSWHRIQEYIPLFGDYIPRRGTNKAKCIVPGRFLSLYLADWPGTVHPEESKNVAILNPWTDSISWEQTERILVPPWSGATFQ
jgi:hypothetical protein